jgi:hypothetical protein
LIVTITTIRSRKLMSLRINYLQVENRRGPPPPVSLLDGRKMKKRFIRSRVLGIVISAYAFSGPAPHNRA